MSEPRVCRHGWPEKSCGVCRYLPLTEAARLLGITAATLRQSIARGAIEAEKIGRDWFVTRTEVARYARSRRPRLQPPDLGK